MRLLGAHMSIAGGVDQAIDRGEELGCTAIQIFVKNNNQWQGRPLNPPEIKNFIRRREETGIFVFAHAGYLINLATNDPANHKKSMDSMLDELERCEKLKIPFLVVHPGSHLKQGEEIGLKKIIESINSLLKSTKDYKVKIALETTAGQGSNLGYKFEHLAQIIEGVAKKERLGVCFDTCHSFAAGYPINKETFSEFGMVIGIDKLLAFHFNDCKEDLGSKKDRHEHIGQGKIGKEGFRIILNDPRFKDVPMVLETPNDQENKLNLMNIKTLRSLIE
ncbi:MAG: deoxyribonuclease IV [bacterium]